MKPTTLFSFLFVSFIPLIATAQKNNIVSEAPCCAILSVGSVDGIVQPYGLGPVDAITLVRDNLTGRTFIFSANALENNLHVGDAISVDMKARKITSINAVSKTYSISEPNPGTPCCAITNIQQGAPCCNIVSVQSNGNNFSFSVPKAVSNNLKIGQPAFMALQNSYAFFQLNTNGSMATYSYPAQNSTTMSSKNDSTHRSERVPDGTSNGSNGGMTRETMGNNSWEIKEDPELKGLGGEVILDIPDKLSFHAHLMFFEAGDTKTQVASWFSSNSSKLLPGLYDISVDSKYIIKNVPVEKGKRTRLKMGVLSVSSYGSFELENSNHEKISYAPPFSIILPEGIYYILGKKKFKIEIKDGELTEL